MKQPTLPLTRPLVPENFTCAGCRTAFGIHGRHRVEHGAWVRRWWCAGCLPAGEA